jgi:site-specific DNA-methyltransferase (adenine-specific)
VGLIYDPFAGSGSTLAAAAAMNLGALGTDSDPQYFAMAKRVFEPLSRLQVHSYE